VTTSTKIVIIIIEDKDILRRTSVSLPLKFEFFRRGVRKSLENFAEKVMLVSWPSFAGMYPLRRRQDSQKDMGGLTHVRSHEKPLRKRVARQILLKQCEILDIRTALRTVGYGVIYNQGAASQVSESISQIAI